MAVAAGYTPGTKEYRSFQRTIQRNTTTATQRRNSGAATLSKLTQAQQQQIAQRKQIAQTIRDARKQQGTTAAAPFPLKFTIRGNIQVDNSPAEQRRFSKPRDVRIKITTQEALKLLRDGELERLLVWEFFGDPDGYPITTANLSVRAGW
jgi:hypothetical protein